MLAAQSDERVSREDSPVIAEVRKLSIALFVVVASSRHRFAWHESWPLEATATKAVRRFWATLGISPLAP